MRAPPEAVKTISGLSCSTASRAAVTSASPTPAPMEPPMKENSKAATTARCPSMAPCATTTASSCPALAFSACSNRSFSNLVSTFAGWPAGGAGAGAATAAGMGALALGGMGTSTRRAPEPRLWTIGSPSLVTTTWQNRF